jgi:hypothetical protein
LSESGQTSTFTTLIESIVNLTTVFDRLETPISVDRCDKAVITALAEIIDVIVAVGNYSQARVFFGIGLSEPG